jgi:hypothetical protein
MNTTTNPVPVTGTVNVANTTPIPVTGTVGVAENPARSAVQQQIPIPFSGGGGHEANQSSITIPVNKGIFVLEFVSFSALFGTGGSLESLSIQVTGNSITDGQVSIEYSLVVPQQPDVFGDFIGTQPLRLYAQPGTSLVVAANVENGIGATTVFVNLSGYFVSAQ